MEPSRRCAKRATEGCRQWQPCSVHGTSNWKNSKSPELPQDWKARKRAVLRRDGEFCRICGSTQGLELDHRVPRSQGGTHELSNLQLLCRPCHRAKGREDKKKAPP